MKRIPKWTAIALIVVGGVGLAMNFSNLRGAEAQVDRTAAIAPDHVQQAGSSASALAAVDNASLQGDERWQEVRKRWEFDSGAFQNLSLSSTDDVHIEVKTDADTDYLELRGVVSKEAAERTLKTTGEADGIKLDLTGPSRIRLISFGSGNNEVYLTLGLRDADQLRSAEFSIGSGTGDFGDFHAGRIEVDLSSGQLKADRLSGDDIALNLTSGSLDVNELIGASQIKLSSGMAKIAALEGDSVIRATSGMIDVTQRKSGNLDAEVSSGKIDIRTAEDFKGVYDLRVTSGLINAPESPGTDGDTIKARATSGMITVKQ
ncbi:DUF4097 family beta strand repeat-containing protein [Saccharibacillus sp. O23]|uniref:DUF4097 family beta strand repeat-containing protein n=1 Tax=Saccharibacillus sp. O23 TaxID=2009338 RepID=UPI0015C68047|nr:DUF4097 family beta strand repeat-containing protein [Saccharibacillus sp. O23]